MTDGIQFFYVYVLQSKKDRKFYVGFTNNLKNRIDQHNLGKVKSSQNRKPFKLVYCEASLCKKDALQREKYLKTAWGKRYIKNRIKSYLTG